MMRSDIPGMFGDATRLVLPVALPVALLVALIILPASAAAPSQHTRPREPVAPKSTPGPARLPALGDPAPDDLLKRAARSKPCDVGEGRTDPCTILTLGRDRITLAWDATTHRITYLFSATLDTDANIRAGDVLGINTDSPITPFPAPGAPHRFLTVDWCDTDADLTGRTLWCAVMVPVRPHSGKVVGFVQSIYLYLPEFDPLPMHRSVWRKRKAAQP